MVDGAKEISVSFLGESCNLFLFEGCLDSSALNFALDARFGLDGAAFFLTLAETGPNSAVVPLTSALPPGIALDLHLRDPRRLSQLTGPLRDQDDAGKGVGSLSVEVRGGLGLSRTCSSGMDKSLGDPDDLAQCMEMEYIRQRPITSAALSRSGVQDAATPSSPSCQRRKRRSPDERDAPLLQHSYDIASPRGEEEGDERRPSLLAQMSWMSAASKQQVALAEAVDVVDRLSRLNLDLANERTLLAWTRTSLAFMRTFFPFLGLGGIGFQWALVMGVRAGILLLTLLAAVFGVLRYVQVKRVTFAPVSGNVRFGRFTIHWFTTLLILGAVLMVAANVATAFQPLKK